MGYYCSPHISYDIFKSSLNFISNVPGASALIIFGDFNLPTIDWSEPNNCTQAKDRAFVDFCSDRSLYQINVEPTRGTNVLDLVLTDDPLLVSRLNVGPPLGKSDHCSILVNIALLSCSVFNTHVNNVANVIKRSWHEVDWGAFSEYVTSIDWSIVYNGCVSANDFWKAFSDCLNDCCDYFVPVKCISVFNNKKLGQSKRITNLQAKRLKLWKRLKHDPTDENRSAYKQCTTHIEMALHDQTLRNETSIIESKNLGSLYKHINNRLCHTSGIAPLLTHDGDLLVNDRDKANLLNSHFVKVGTTDNGVRPTV